MKYTLFYQGAFPSEWEKLIRKHLTHDDDIAVANVGTFEGPGGKGDLLNYIDLRSCHCSNVVEPADMGLFLSRQGHRFVSDTDQEIIMYIQFNQNVKVRLELRTSESDSACTFLHLLLLFMSNIISAYMFPQLSSIKVKGPSDNGPARMKLFINPVKSMDFDDVAQSVPAQEIRYYHK